MSDPAKNADSLLRLAEAVCDETATAEEFGQLDFLLAGDEQSRRVYLDYCELHFALGLDLQAHWEGQKACRQIDQLVSATVEPDRPVGEEASTTTRVVSGVTFFGSAIHGAGSYFTSGWPMAYLVATVVLGFGLMLGTVTHISPLSQIAEIKTPTNTVRSPSATKSPVVGRVTGVVDCVFNNAELRTTNGIQHSACSIQHSPVSLGDRIALRSGLLEITYDTGAKVILQGPVTYDVSSATGGYLSAGALTARLKSKGVQRPAGLWWLADETVVALANKEKSGASSDGRESATNAFTVTTPTAVVTDLGTEFAVDVRGPDSTDTHVFQGVVEVQVRDGSAKKPICLKERESLHVKAERGQVAAVSYEPINGEKFVRRMPSQGKRMPVAIYGTGTATDQWGRDSQWTIVRVSNDPRFQPQPAYAVQNLPNDWLANSSGRSSWISTVFDAAALPNRVTYTFRTTFSLIGHDPETAALTGWFIADGYVRAMRLNGHELEVPRHRHDPPYDLFTRFTVSDGCVDGTNVLEVDVENAESSDATGASPMGLRMELKATARIAP